MNPTSNNSAFLAARDLLLAHREDYDTAYRAFRWPVLEHFNWALDYFDPFARDNDALALWVVDAAETRLTFAQLRQRSNQLANHLRALGLRRGERIMPMLPNHPLLWELTLAAIKLGAVIVPASTQLSSEEAADRIERADVGWVVALERERGRVRERTRHRLTLGSSPGWISLDDASQGSADFEPDRPTRADEPLFLYFTSGTTSRPKLVVHTHQSYPVGHLSTMYWIGLRPGDLHWNVSSPGWAKHAWSSVFAPWNAGAAVFATNYAQFSARTMLEQLGSFPVTTLCAPPTVWRMLLQEDLTAYSHRLREAVGAGEPLNPEIIERVRAAWGLALRDGYGQTETTCLVGNSPGQALRAGSMGRPLPGYRPHLGPEGELLLDRADPPLGLMPGYFDGTAAIIREPFYRSGDLVEVDGEGYYTSVGRTDDVFKSSGYRISPFELESVLLEHPAVAEAAVVPSPHPLRLTVPKAFVALAAGYAPDQDVASDIFRFCASRMAPYKRIRRLEFAELPKTVSGKIRRTELRALEGDGTRPDFRDSHEPQA